MLRSTFQSPVEGIQLSGNDGQEDAGETRDRTWQNWNSI